ADAAGEGAEGQERVGQVVRELAVVVKVGKDLDVGGTLVGADRQFVAAVAVEVTGGHEDAAAERPEGQEGIDDAADAAVGVEVPEEAVGGGAGAEGGARFVVRVPVEAPQGHADAAGETAERVEVHRLAAGGGGRLVGAVVVGVGEDADGPGHAGVAADGQQAG